MRRSFSPRSSVRLVLSVLLVLGLFFELSLRVLTAWKEPKGRFTWMLGKNRLEVLGERDSYRFFTGKKSTTVSFGPMKLDFNNLGYRSTNTEILPKHEGTFRVACFGDSVTFGQYEWDYYDTWPGAMERALKRMDTRKDVEVLNFGMAHYTLTINLVNLALIGRYVEPDLVVFLSCPNDFISLYAKEYTPDGSQDGKWLLPVTDAVWGFHPIGDIVNRSRVGALLYGLGAKGLLLLQAKKLFSMSLSDEAVESRLAIMARHVGTICVLSKGLGAVPVLCSYLYDEKRLLEKRGKDFQVLLHRIDDTVRRVAADEKAVIVHARDAMKDRGDFFTDEFHLSSKGNAAFAGIVIDVLKSQGLLPLEPDPATRKTASTSSDPGRSGKP